MAKSTHKKLPRAVLDYLRNMGRKNAKAGGRARMNAMTPEQRQALARKAAKARWNRKKATRT